MLKQTDKRVHNFFIGDGELRSELEQVISNHGLQSQIQVLGWRQDVAALLSGLDIFVLPSRWEGTTLAILEAMASSLPVIASDLSGNRDLVSHGVEGILFDSDNDERLAHGRKMRDESAGCWWCLINTAFNSRTRTLPVLTSGNF